MVRIYILAGTAEQAEWLARKHEIPLSNWRYISRRECLYGLRGGVVWLYGTFYERRDFREIEANLRERGLQQFLIRDN